MRKALPIALLLLGAASLILGWLGETVLAPEKTHTATVQLKDPGPAVVIEPGVLYVGGKEGTVTVKADGEITQIAARPADVDAYLEGTKHTVITGVPSWTTLKAEPRNPDGAAELPNAGVSDLWLDQNKSASPFSMRIEDWAKAETASTGADAPYRSLVFITDGTKPGAAEVTITWPVAQTMKWQPWALALGAVLMIIGLVMLLLMRTKGTDQPAEVAPAATEDAEARPVARRRLGEAAAGAAGSSALGAAAATTDVDHDPTAVVTPIAEDPAVDDTAVDDTVVSEPISAELIDDEAALEHDDAENSPAVEEPRPARRRRITAADLAADAFGKHDATAQHHTHRADIQNENPEDLR